MEKEKNVERERRKKELKKAFAIFVFLLPGLLLFVSILIAPIAVSVYRSLYDWNGFSEGTFIGFNNYIELFTNGSIKFMTSLKNSLIFIGTRSNTNYYILLYHNSTLCSRDFAKNRGGSLRLYLIVFRMDYSAYSI